MLLSILIPTYNRAKDLKKNLLQLNEYISELGLLHDIAIIISNNNSSDSTHELITKLQPELSIQLVYFEQKENIGLKKNALYVLEQAKSDYVMYLGDDDFITKEYLQGVTEKIEQIEDIACVIPSFVPIDIDGNQLSGGRDIKLESKIYEKGYKNCLENSWRGHQLSGLVFKCDGLAKAYRRYNIDNIYLFIFFTAYSCLQGKTYHLTDYPVKVTQPGQENKDWGYGDDGLLNEVFDNYIKLPLSSFKRSKLQLKFFRKQPWRLWHYKENGYAKLFKAYKLILQNNNSHYLFCVMFSILFFGQLIKRLLIGRSKY